MQFGFTEKARAADALTSAWQAIVSARQRLRYERAGNVVELATWRALREGGSP